MFKLRLETTEEKLIKRAKYQKHRVCDKCNRVRTIHGLAGRQCESCDVKFKRSGKLQLGLGMTMMAISAGLLHADGIPIIEPMIGYMMLGAIGLMFFMGSWNNYDLREGTKLEIRV